MIGAEISNHRIVEEVGNGSQAQVFAAVHTQLDQRVAIKVLRKEFAADRQFLMRFLGEARMDGVIDHPGIVKVHDVGVVRDSDPSLNERPYIIMEYLNGETLSTRLARITAGGSHAPEPAQLLPLLRLFRQVVLAVDAAHRKDVVHRDLKPANIMIVTDPQHHGTEIAKVLDFGIAKIHERHYKAEETVPDSMRSKAVNPAVMGTPHFMAPEQCTPTWKISSKTDVYALGSILYQIASGRLMFPSGTPAVVMTMQILEQPRPLREVAPAVPEKLAALAHRMLQKRPVDRPELGEVLDVLDPILQALSSFHSPTVVGGAAHALTHITRDPTPAHRDPTPVPPARAPSAVSVPLRATEAHDPAPRWPWVLVALAGTTAVAGVGLLWGYLAR